MSSRAWNKTPPFTVTLYLYTYVTDLQCEVYLLHSLCGAKREQSHYHCNKHVFYPSIYVYIFKGVN